jgi:RNA polymerase sigma-70 factor (ECF subfamily)
MARERPDESAALDDAALVSRIAAGPEDGREAEAELFRRFSARVLLYGRRHLRDEQAAADLVQEVMAAVIEAVRGGRVDAPDRLRQFILGTCRFMTWRMRKGEWQRSEAAVRSGLETSAETAPAGHATLDAERLERCLATLPPREQRIMYLSFTEERTAPEIAAELSLTEGNVRVIRHRALLRLRACLEGGAGPDGPAAPGERGGGEGS